MKRTFSPGVFKPRAFNPITLTGVLVVTEVNGVFVRACQAYQVHPDACQASEQYPVEECDIFQPAVEALEVS